MRRDDARCGSRWVGALGFSHHLRVLSWRQPLRPDGMFLVSSCWVRELLQYRFRVLPLWVARVALFLSAVLGFYHCMLLVLHCFLGVKEVLGMLF